MSWADLIGDLDAEVRTHLCEPAEVRPAGGGDPKVVLVMIEDDLEARGLNLNAPVRTVTVEVHADDHALRRHDVFVPGRMVAGAFVAGNKAWKVTGAATRDGGWQKANAEPASP